MERGNQKEIENLQEYFCGKYCFNKVLIKYLKEDSIYEVKIGRSAVADGIYYMDEFEADNILTGVYPRG